MYRGHLFRAILLLGSLAALAYGNAEPRCDENVVLQVSATASNKMIPLGLKISSLSPGDGFDPSSFEENLVSGSYAIAGRYCEPTNDVPKRRSTLQLLVHGITYDRNYWSGMGPPGQSFNDTAYSWIHYASLQGYPTFSVDRICNGASTRANAVVVCQVPMNAETLAQVIIAAKEGKLGGRRFQKVIYVGHSEGSFIGNSLAQLHPSAVDTYVLTGFTKFLVVGAFGTILSGNFLPASIVDPARFGALALDPAYLVATNPKGVKGFFYYGDFAQDLADRDYANRGTVTEGEFFTALLGQFPAPEFKGAAIALTGGNDQIVCARSVQDPLIGYKGDCGEGSASFPARTRSLYPNARRFSYYNVNNTGHDQNFHYSAQATFKVAHKFLASEGF